ncbi:hypothetical protein [Bacillus cereus]|nr:hypothetical protein [Bacillus cereus]MCU4785362.1 hypothetical protein [Bacillus cereus]MCU5553479.1 hypothetical protein [Bacillus cereus]
MGYLGKNTLFFSGVIYIKIHIEDKKLHPTSFRKREVRWSFFK